MFYKKTVLDNGLTILSEEMNSVHSISLGFWFQVGSRDELPAEAGMSHFNEHMMFKGTPSVDAQTLSEKFDRLGARQNAFTSKEATCYYSDFLDESLPEVFKLMSDMVLNASMDEEQCLTEREVVIEEIARSEDDPEDIAFELFCKSLWPHHTLGLSVAGTRESVGSFGSREARAYHKKHYTAQNCTIVAAGNVNHDELVALAEKYTAHMPQGETKNADMRKAPQSSASGQFNFTKETEQAHLFMGGACVSQRDEDRYAYAMANFLLGGSMSSRLFQEVREKLGLVYAVYSFLQPYADTGFFGIYAGTRPENTEKVVEVVRRELDKFAQGALTEDDRDLAYHAIKGSLALSLESTSQRMRSLGSAYLANGFALSYDETVALYEKVDLAKLHEVAAHMAANNSVLALVGNYQPDYRIEGY